MSAFNGVIAIRGYTTRFPEIPLPEVIASLRRLSPDDGYHDYEAALALLELVPEQAVDIDPPTLFRHVLKCVVLDCQPWWMRMATFGRERIRAALSIRETQCFEAAELFTETPNLEIRQWWDHLSQAVRADSNADRLMQGRNAEQLTVDHEVRRLEALGIPMRPRWVSIDDNTAGYDVQSYDPGSVEPIAKLIEVKSCARIEPEIFLTRNEWETAVERASHYCFHVWLLPENRLIELTPEDIGRHVPQDHGDGQWQNVKIPLSLAYTETR